MSRPTHTRRTSNIVNCSASSAEQNWVLFTDASARAAR